jgi:hypothetical protein
VLGSPDVPRFASTPDRKDGTELPPFSYLCRASNSCFCRC